MKKLLLPGVLLPLLLLLWTAWSSPAAAQCNGGMMGQCSDTTCHAPGQTCDPTNCPGGMMGNCMGDSSCSGGSGSCHQGGGGGNCTMPNCPMQGMCDMMGMNCGGMMGSCPDSVGCHSTTTQHDRAHMLLAGRPNPFNPLTALSYTLSTGAQVRLSIWDTAGRLVQTLVDGWQEAGVHAATFDGSNQPAGIYLARLQAGNRISTIKLVMIK